MKKSKLLAGILSVAMVSTMLVGCGSSSSTGDDSSTKKYTIACDAKYSPFSMEENGEYIGIDVEILDAIAEVEGFEYDLKPMDFTAIISALTANQIDGAIAGMSITDERKETFDFSDGYFESGLSLVVKGDNNEITSMDDIYGKSVAVKNSTSGEKWALANEEKYNLTISHYEDSPTMYLAVENGNNDFAIEDYPVISYNIKVADDGGLKIVGDKFDTCEYGFAVKKDSNAELMEMFQEGLEKIKENGTYDEIIGKYID